MSSEEEGVVHPELQSSRVCGVGCPHTSASDRIDFERVVWTQETFWWSSGTPERGKQERAAPGLALDCEFNSSGPDDF